MNTLPDSLKDYCQYDLTSFPPDWIYRGIDFPSGQNEEELRDRSRFKFGGGWQYIPHLTSKVKITFNGLGTGTVVSYFTEHSFIGVCVKLDNPPAWHTRQNKGRKSANGVNMEGHALVFGSEIELA